MQARDFSLTVGAALEAERESLRGSKSLRVQYDTPGEPRCFNA